MLNVLVDLSTSKNETCRGDSSEYDETSSTKKLFVQRNRRQNGAEFRHVKNVVKSKDSEANHMPKKLPSSLKTKKLRKCYPNPAQTAFMSYGKELKLMNEVIS